MSLPRVTQPGAAQLHSPMDKGCKLAGQQQVTSKATVGTSLRMVPGEVQLFRATKKGGCPLPGTTESTMVVSDQRVMFLWRQRVCGFSVASLEEAFYLNDLQFVRLGRIMSWRWLWLGLMGILIGTIMIVAADQISKAASSYTGSASIAADASATAAVLAVGIILLLAGIIGLVVFVVKHTSRGVYMSLNFCRKDVGIMDWHAGSWWRPRMSSTLRVIKLSKPDAQEAYHVLCGLLHNKLSLPGAQQPGKCPRDSASSP